MTRRAWMPFIAITVVLGVACGARTGGSTPSSPPPSPSPSPGGEPLSQPALKLRVLDAVGGHLSYCDPDVYPVGRGTALQNARERMPEIRKDREAFDAIVEFEGLDPDNLSDDDHITINEDYKQIQAIELTPEGDGFSFSLLVADTSGDYSNSHVSGTVDAFGKVELGEKQPGEPLNCPICLARGVVIATPNGPVAVQDVTVGMTVWTTDRAGHRVRATVVRTGRTPVPSTHMVVRLVLADGRTVLVSPGHPTADRTRVGDLRAGQLFEGTRVVSAGRVAYAGGFTYDLLPSGATGTYFANGVLLGSTLR